MKSNNVELAKSYYLAMIENDFDHMEYCLSEHVEFVSPFATLAGKEKVFEAAKNFASSVPSLNIRQQFENTEAVMLVIDINFAAPIGKLRSTSMIKIKDDKIVSIELFFDGLQMQNS